MKKKHIFCYPEICQTLVDENGETNRWSDAGWESLEDAAADYERIVDEVYREDFCDKFPEDEIQVLTTKNSVEFRHGKILHRLEFECNPTIEEY